MSERYPKVNQRLGRIPVEATILEHYGEVPAVPPSPPDPLSLCSTAPVIDRLYIDMNGIIHGCSHNNNNDAEDDSEKAVVGISETEIFTNVCFYLDRIVKDIAQPTSIVYMAIDGVAPRAKLNQQRSRRYRSGKEGLIEQTIYDAHLKQMMTTEVAENGAEVPPGNLGGLFFEEEVGDDKDDAVKEIEPGRFAGKFLAHLNSLEDVIESKNNDTSTQSDTKERGHIFHSNTITPGTPFFSRCTAHIQHFLQRKVSEDPAWQNLTIIFSGPNVPGEGEHKILAFMREQKCAYEQGTIPSDDEASAKSSSSVAYHPNLSHCITGQDGDLIMLGLLTHEPNLVLLREQVLFNTRRRNVAANTAAALQSYVHNPNFELLHMSILRDYFSYEFETSNVIPDSPWCLEHCIDDFVFMTFFVGNDFLPHMPAVDIADEAFDLLFYTYREQRKRWLNDDTKIPYLTDKGSIVSGQRLEDFLQVLGKHETPYLEYKKSTDDTEMARQLEAKYGMNTIPSDEARAAKEASDRALFREHIVQKKVNGFIYDEAVEEEEDGGEIDEALHFSGFQPVLSSAQPTKRSNPKRHDDDTEEAEAIYERMSGLLRYTVKEGKDVQISVEDLKGRYYSDKFGFSPFDAEKHVALRKAYIEGLVWNLKYYYEGCVSWEWYYPYHYGPMLSDLVGIDAMLKEISFEGRLGNPLRPFEQLMACMPPSHADVLPQPYRQFMTDSESSIADFYPQSFTIDMNGKRWPWEAVVLLPFIDSSRLLEVVRTVDESLLTDDERRRNEFGGVAVFSRDPATSFRVEAVGEGGIFGDVKECKAKSIPFESSSLHLMSSGFKPVFKPDLLEGVELPLPGFPTLRDGTVQGLWRKLLRVNVHGSKSRYKTACLEIENPIPEVLPAETLAGLLNGTLLWTNYPHFVEGFVTAVSDSQGIIRGNSKRKAWNGEDQVRRKRRVRKIVGNYVFGEKLVGTGGLSLVGGEDAMDHLDILLYVRPFCGLKKLEDGTVVKTYAKYEVEVPLFVTGWAPRRLDRRFTNLPVRLEKDPYHSAKYVLTDRRSDDWPSTDLNNALSQRGGKKLQFPKRINEARFYHSQCTASFPSAAISHSLALKHACNYEPRVQIQESALQQIECRSRVGAFGRSVLAIGGRGPSSQGMFNMPINTRRHMTLVSASQAPATKITLPTRYVVRSLRGRVLIVGAVVAMSYFASVGAVEFGTRIVGIHGTGRNSAEEGLSSQDSCDFPLSKGSAPPLEFSHGTTTLSFAFQGGIVTAVDSRASLGSFVGSKTTQKVLPVNSHVLGTMAGGAADCTFWIRKLRCEAALHELTEGRRMSVSQASRLLSNALYELRGLQLSVGTMVMGFDSSTPRIYYVDNTGMRIEGDVFAVGSGSNFALGILDAERRYDMSIEEAVALGIKAIRHSTFRDAFSGGFINVYLITARDGWKRVFTEDPDEMMASRAEYSDEESP